MRSSIKSMGSRADIPTDLIDEHGRAVALQSDIILGPFGRDI